MNRIVSDWKLLGEAYPQLLWLLGLLGFGTGLAIAYCLWYKFAKRLRLARERQGELLARSEAEDRAEPDTAPIPPTEIDPELGIVFTTAPANPDDLTELDGIDPDLAADLNAAGVYQRSQLENFDQAQREAFAYRFGLEEIDWDGWGFPAIAGDETSEAPAFDQSFSATDDYELDISLNPSTSGPNEITKEDPPDLPLTISETEIDHGSIAALTAKEADYIYEVEIDQGKATATSHSPECESVTGYSPDDFQSDSNLWINMVDDADKDRVATHASETLAGYSEATINHRIWTKNGELRWVRNTPVIERDETGAVIGYVGLVKDITAEKEN
ncbi:MAG: PAS domain-containing protein [Verrucomicrobiota bacterium]